MFDERTGKTALVVGSAAAIAAAIALPKKTASAKSSGIVSLDEAAINLLIAIAQGIENLNQSFQNLIPGEPGQMVIQGWPPNTDNVEIARIGIAALNTAYQLPDIIVPDGFTLLVKAWFTNAGIIYVARSDPDARNINQVWPLIPNDFVGVNIKNANRLFLSGTAVGDFATLLVEQRGGG